MSDHEEKHDAPHAEGEAHEEGHSHKGGHHGAHGGGHGDEHGGCPEWLVSFADNVALLMGFFVILLAMNMNKPEAHEGFGGEPGNPPNNKMLDMIIDIRQGFNNPVDMMSTNPSEAPLRKRLKERAGGELRTENPRGLADTANSIDRGERISPSITVNFAPESGDLDSTGKDALRQGAGELRGGGFVIEVRGHVSADEREKLKGPAGAMRLSFDRAEATARVLAASGIPWKQLRLVGCADNERAEPLAYDENARRSNRRAEVIVTSDPVPPDPHNTSPGAKGKDAAGGSGRE